MQRRRKLPNRNDPMTTMWHIKITPENSANKFHNPHFKSINARLRGRLEARRPKESKE